MAFFSAIPVPETQVGIAIEKERGKVEAPEFWLPVQSPKYKPDLQLLPDQGLRGSMVTLYDEVIGLRYDSHGWDAHPYLDSFPVFLRAVLGSKDKKTVAPTSTELVKEAKAGDTKILTKETIAEGSYVVIGTGVGTQETRQTGKPKEVKAEEWEIPLVYPLSYAHVVKATVTGLTKHEFSLLNNAPAEGNQPPSVSIFDFVGDEHWRALPASQLDTLNISATADTLPKVAYTWMANSAVTPETPSASYSEAEAPPGWTVTTAIGGTQIGHLVSWEIDLKRGVKNVPAITGTEAYYQHFAYALDATAKLTLLEDPKATWLTAFEVGESNSLDITLSDVKSGFAVNFHSTVSKFTTADLDRTKEWVELPLAVQLIPSATDALAGGVSPIHVTVANSHTAEY